MLSGLAVATLALPAPALEEDPWKVFRPEGESFEVELPGDPVPERNSIITPAGPSNEVRYPLQLGDSELAVELHDFPAIGAFFLSDRSILERTRNGVVEGRGARLTGSREMRLHGSPALEFSYEVPGEPVLRGLVRSVLVGSRIYLLMGTVPGDPGTDPDVARFLGSFRIFEPED